VDAFASAVLRHLVESPPPHRVHEEERNAAPSWQEIARREWSVIVGSPAE
jgi:hypothetical protein